MKHKKQAAPLADTSPAPRQKRPTRKQRKAEEKRILPVHKRPVICPPDKAGRKPVFRLLGLLCRALVIWLGAAGLTIFLADALQLGVAYRTIFLCSLVVVALGTLFFQGTAGKILATVAAGGTVAGMLLVNPRLPTDLVWGLVSLYNAALERLYRVGYLVYIQYQVPVESSTAPAELLALGVGVVAVVISLLFTLCLAGRVHILPPAILSTTLLVVMLTFNIYSNRIESNLGIALVLVSFASILVMAAYDNLYAKRDRRQYDTELSLFEDDDRPVMPEVYTRDLVEKAARKARKAERRKKKREHTVTVEDEIDDYFRRGKKSRKAPGSGSTRDDRQARKEARALRKQIRAVKRYDRVTSQVRRAMGGYAAAAMLVICLVAVVLPATLVQGNFNTIDVIDEKVSLARDYVTALLRGDDKQLDRLEYQADADNFEPHSTELKHQEFRERQMFYIMSRYRTNYYMRGWIGTDYRDGAWLAVDDETLADYQDTFGKDSSPAEEMRYDFYHYMKPDLVDDTAFTDDLMGRYNAEADYGFVALLVSQRRINSDSSLAYFPASYDPRYGLMEYDRVEQSPLSFVNYYDGIYTGRGFKESGVRYATVAYAPIMHDPNWIVNQADLQATYQLQKEALLAHLASQSGRLNLVTEEQKNGMTMFVYSCRSGGEEQVWRFYHATNSVTKNRGQLVIRTDGGLLILTMAGDLVKGVEYHNTTEVTDTNLLHAYESYMTDETREALMDYLTTDSNYGDFVYRTYLGTSDSLYIKELAATIRAQAHVEGKETVTEILPPIPDDPESVEETITYEVTVNVPADVSLAAVRNATNAQVYIQRDRLVRNVIDYLITEQGCTYTLTPDLSLVDDDLCGVENFLANTKEGYCVQFASAVTLLLREMGIPARYVEGYVAGDMKKVSGADFLYADYVYDYEAHAWVEVYYDGIGWIQYETTPPYYAGLYGTAGSVGSLPVPPVLPVEPDETTPTDDDPMDTLPEDESQGEIDTEVDTGIAGEAPLVDTRNLLIGVGIVVMLGAIAVGIYTVVSHARQAEDHRASIAAQILDTGFGAHTSDEDRREMALEMTDSVMGLLQIYGLSPQPGEFREDYAKRLAQELASNEEGGISEQDLLPDLMVVMDGMAAEEFGHGMSLTEMKATANLYHFLRRDLRRRLTPGERFKLRYIQRKI